MRFESRSLLLFAVVAALVAGPAAAQDEGLSRTEIEYLAQAGPETSIVPTGPDVPGSPDWGIVDFTWHVVPASACAEIDDQPYVSLFGWRGGTGTGVYRMWDCPVVLPSGSLIYAMGAEVNDNDPNESVAFWLRVYVLYGTSYTTEAYAGTMISGMLGRHYLGPVSPDYTINNQTNVYAVRVRTGASNATQFRSVFIAAKLQVSPAPASATFLDVPTGHWAFQFIQALVDSGITAGCGGGKYCPNANVTRAEMAVFLAGGLGLHWPY